MSSPEDELIEPPPIDPPDNTLPEEDAEPPQDMGLANPEPAINPPDNT